MTKFCERWRLSSTLLLIVPLLVLFGFGDNAGSDDKLKNSDTYTQEILEWRAKHEKQFRSANGWLALIGHYWLIEGDNSFGAREDSHVQLPNISGLKASGNFRLNKNKVGLQVDPGSQVLVNDKSTADTPLAIEASLPETNGTDSIQVGDRVTMQLVKRNNRFAVRVRDSQSPLIAEFQGKHWYPVDSKYRVDAVLTKFAKPKPIKIINIKGDETESKLIGRLEFTIDQRTFTLDALADSPDELFIIFKDKTSGKTSYGAGRFLDVPLPAEGDKVVLDFNQAYSPPCAFSPHTLCPLPPKQNQLDVAIEAGERLTAYGE
jgi:uncharacterized protein